MPWVCGPQDSDGVNKQANRDSVLKRPEDFHQWFGSFALPFAWKKSCDVRMHLFGCPMHCTVWKNTDCMEECFLMISSTCSWRGGFEPHILLQPYISLAWFSLTSFRSSQYTLKVANTSFSQVECNQECVGVLKSRMKQGLLPEAEIVTDVRYFSAKGTKAAGVTAGFPCQASNLYNWTENCYNCQCVKVLLGHLRAT